MAKYICETKCYYRKREWKPGETLDSKEGEIVPAWFKPKGTKVVEVEVAEDVDADKLSDAIKNGDPKTFSEAAKIQAEEDKKALGQFSEENINSDTPPASNYNFLE